MSKEVDSTVNENLVTLNREFEESVSHSRGASFTSVQNLGQNLLDLEVSQNKLVPVNNRQLPVIQPSTDQNATIQRLQGEVDSYKLELEKVRPNYESVSRICNKLDIDPSIATVRHLLELLNSAQENDILLQNQVKDLSDKLFNTNKVLVAQKEACLELETKLKEMEVSDGKKIEGNITEIMQYFKKLITDIKDQLEEKGVRLDVDFWFTPITSMQEFVTRVLEREQKEKEDNLRRNVSNAGTDVWSEGEAMAIPVEGFHPDGKVNQTTSLVLEDDDVEEGRRADQKTKACTIQ